MKLFRKLKKELIKMFVMTILMILIFMQLSFLNFSQVFALEKNVWKISESKTDLVIASLDEEGTLTISGKGNMIDFYNYVGPGKYWNAVSERVKKVIINDGILNIGNNAFVGCKNLVNVTISKSVTSIGDSVFRGCSSLTNIQIPDSVTSIGSWSFERCSSLTSINIPEGVTSIGDDAFENCSSLTNINVNIKNRKYSSEEGILFNKNKTTLIQYPRGRQDTTYVISKNVTSIGKSAFENCNSLTNIQIPESVTVIGDNAFTSCSNLTTINISEGVTSIGKGVFSGCGSLTSINIPERVASIGKGVFSDCDNLTNIDVNIENQKYSSEGGVLFDKNKTTLIQYPRGKQDTTYVIPKDVTSIGDSAFRSCNSLTNIQIPESVTVIGNSAFESCSNLTTINIPEGVTSIGSDAFYWCSSLTSINIPEGVTSIGDGAFAQVNIKYITKENEISVDDLDIIKRLKDSNNILYASNIELTNCSFNEDESKLLLDNDKIQTNEWAKITIKDGKLTGLTCFVGKDKWNVSKGEEDSVIATLSEEGTLTISGKGSMLDLDNGDEYAWHRVAERVKTVVIEEGITNIGDNAFWLCKNLINIKTSESIESIGTDAFYYCINLSDFNIPESVTSIGTDTFYGCEKLTSIKIPKNVTYLGEISRNSGLTNIDVDIENQTYSSEEGVLFDKNKKTLIQYPRGKKDTVYSIPEGVTNSMENNFLNCTSLIIPKSMDNIKLFNSINLINIDVNIENQKYSSEGGVLFDKNKTTLIQYPIGKQDTTYVIPKDVTSIGDYAFDGCSSLTNIKIPESVTVIGNNAFAHCSNLTNIKIPENVTVIGDNAFAHCSNLTSIEIPEGVTSIGDAAFEYCSSLTSINIPEGVTNIGDGAFTQVNIKYITKENEIPVDDLDIIKRLKDSNNILYASNIELTNCSFNEDESKLLLDNDKIQTGGWAKIVIKNGKLQGLTYYIVKNTWNIGDITEENKIVGDINGDKMVNVTDLLLLKRHVIAESKESWKLKGEQLKRADINEDGEINITDIFLMKRLVLENM